MNKFKNALIVSAAALAIAATPTAIFAQTPKGNADAVQDVEKKAQQGAKQNANSPSSGGVQTKTQTGSNAVMDVEKKAQQGAKQNAMSKDGPGVMTKSETANQAVQDAEKKAQQGNQPNR